jgi:hypothetical protein
MRAESLRGTGVTYVSGIIRYLCNRNGHKEDLARPEGQTSNRFEAERLFATLAEWAEYLSGRRPCVPSLCPHVTPA